MKLLHIGCGRKRYEGFINTDKAEMDITKPWPHEDESVDGIISMMVFQCLTWKELIFAFLEAYRVLRRGGVMRMGLVLEDTKRPLSTFLYGANINLFSFDLLKRVLVDRIGFSEIKLCKWRETKIPEFAQVDSRYYIASYPEVTK